MNEGQAIEKGRRVVKDQGFEMFSVRERKAREGRNPQTGERMKT